MKEIVTAVSAIADILNGECVYVDKTAYLHKLITSKDNLFFISRPRRFGKSLMLSTFKAIFEGRKELFEGLAISKKKYDRTVYPVLYFDMSNAIHNSRVNYESQSLNGRSDVAVETKTATYIFELKYNESSQAAPVRDGFRRDFFAGTKLLRQLQRENASAAFTCR